MDVRTMLGEDNIRYIMVDLRHDRVLPDLSGTLTLSCVVEITVFYFSYGSIVVEYERRYSTCCVLESPIPTARKESCRHTSDI